MFVKAPQAGRVKTRLAAALGMDAACQAYSQLVERLLSNLMDLDSVQLRFTPDNAEQEILHWGKACWQRAQQVSGDLGERLQRAFAQSLISGFGKVVVIGSDCPEVTSDDVRAAWRSLDHCDVVLGPAQDGGYWLVGLKSSQPALFENMAWSTDTVFEETRNRAKARGLKVATLRVLRDVDTPEDWKAFCRNSQARMPGGRKL